jgi:hypothetical protein
VDEIVDAAWKHIIVVRPWLETLCVIFGVGYVVLLVIGRLFEVWRSFRTRRAILEEQKIASEILKIRYEIEVLRKQHDLPDLTLAEQPVATAGNRRLEGQTGASRAHTRFGVSLPELPSFSFSPLLSLFKISLKRPDPGMPRAYWALKLLGFAFLVFLVLAIIVIALVPTAGSHDTTGGPQGAAGGVLVLVGGVVAVYLLFVVAVNLVRAALGAVSHGRAAPHA